MQIGLIGDHVASSAQTASFYAAAVALWLVGVVAVVYLKIRRAR
jgi:hypothetical protein